MKTCTICKKSKEYNQFGVLSRSTDGHYPQCKECKSKIDKENYNKKRDQIKENAKNYYKTNKNDILTKRKENKEHYSAYNKNYKKEHIDDIKQYNQIYKNQYKERRNQLRLEKKKNDPLYRLIENLRRKNNRILRDNNWVKDGHFLDFIGCTKEEFKIHLEKQFSSNMNWNNYGNKEGKWSIDHILPISLAKSDSDCKRLNHYTNLRPMMHKLNEFKGDRFNKDICWQKQIRDQLLQDDIKKGCPIAMKANEFELNYEQFNTEHRKFIERYEWLGTCGFGVRYVFTARYKGWLGGVILIAEPNSYQFDMKLEALIQRGACASWTPKNLGSRLIMFACRWMVDNTNKRIFTAYSDPEAGEIGTLYQACNFDYLGNNFGSSYQYKLSNGRLVGDRYFTRTSSMKKWAKQLNIEWLPEWSKVNGFQDIKAIPEDIRKQLMNHAKNLMNMCDKIKKEPKGKYVLLKCNKKEKIEKTWKCLPYPKRNANIEESENV